MRDHHQKAVDRLVALFEPDPRYVALLLCGSIARGWDRDDSDVDIILVATDAEYARRAATNHVSYFNTELAGYPGGYIDGKIVNRAFLAEVAEQGTEPARSAFVGAEAVFTHDPTIPDLLRQIVVYPEEGRQSKIESFYAQVEAMRWYMGEAEKRQDRYLATHVAADLVLFGGRLILAHNRLLYPYHKHFMRVLQEASERPADLPDLIDAVLTRPCAETANRFAGAVLAFADWAKPAEGWGARFMYDIEWAWRRNATAVADR